MAARICRLCKREPQCGHGFAFDYDQRMENLTLGRTGSLRFFFSSRRRHTRFDCDWSSDVCSSDLSLGRALGHEWTNDDRRAFLSAYDVMLDRRAKQVAQVRGQARPATASTGEAVKIGRAHV